jgi:hypothetical protein
MPENSNFWLKRMGEIRGQFALPRRIHSMKGTEIPLFCHRSLDIPRKPAKSSGGVEVPQGFPSSADTKPRKIVSVNPELLAMNIRFFLLQKFLTTTGKRG